MIKQMRGEYRVQTSASRILENQFRRIAFEWIPREDNSRAEELSKSAVDGIGDEWADWFNGW